MTSPNPSSECPKTPEAKCNCAVFYDDKGAKHHYRACPLGEYVEQTPEAVEEVLQEFEREWGGGDESGDFPFGACKAWLRTKLTALTATPAVEGGEWEKDFRERFGIKITPNNEKDCTNAFLLERFWQAGVLTDIVEFIHQLQASTAASEREAGRRHERTEYNEESFNRFAHAAATAGHNAYELGRAEALKACARIVGSHESPHTLSNCRMCKIEALQATPPPQS